MYTLNWEKKKINTHDKSKSEVHFLQILFYFNKLSKDMPENAKAKKPLLDKLNANEDRSTKPSLAVLWSHDQ